MTRDDESDKTMTCKNETTSIARMEVQRGIRAMVVALGCFAICALLALAWFAPRAWAANAGDTSATKPAIIPVEQKYTTNTTGVEDTFAYQLEAVTEGAPMPAGSENGVFTWTMKGATADKLYIEYAGAPYNEWFTYKVHQVQPSENLAGFTFDTAEYNIEAVIWGNDETQVVASTTDASGAVAKPMELAWGVNYDSTTIDEDDTPTDPNKDKDKDKEKSKDSDEDDDDVDDDDSPLDSFTHAVQTGDMSVIVPAVVLVLAIVVALVALIGFVRRRKDQE